MSVYSFMITKGNYQLSLTTTDRDLVSNQFSLWVSKVSEYVQQHKVQECKDKINSEIKAEEKITQDRIDEQLKRSAQKEENQDKNEENNNSLENTNKNLDIFYAPRKEETVTESVEQETAVQAEIEETQKEETVVDSEPKQENPTVNDFDNVLEKSIQNPQTELAFKPNPSIKKDNAFINFLSTKTVEKNIDYLLMTAYYFTQYEQKPRFTLKQLNAKLMQNVAIIIDHSVLQEAINRDYIECLPDLTGLIGASEYRLTAYGEKTLLDE